MSSDDFTFPHLEEDYVKRVPAGFLADSIISRPSHPGRDSGMFERSSPITVAGPRGLSTLFPFIPRGTRTRYVLCFALTLAHLPSVVKKKMMGFPKGSWRGVSGLEGSGKSKRSLRRALSTMLCNYVKFKVTGLLPKSFSVAFWVVGAGLALPITLILLGAASRAPTFFLQILFGQQALTI